MSSDTNTDRLGCRSSSSDLARYSASLSPHRRKPRHSDSLKPGTLDDYQKALVETSTVPAKPESDMSRSSAVRAQESDRLTGLERLQQRRAIEAAIWGLPLVRFDAMRQAFFRDAQATYGDIAYWSKPADWQFQLATASTLSTYVYCNFNTRMGPIVIDMPPAPGMSLTGAIVSAWESTLVEVGHGGFDKGRGGKYLVLPPDYTGMVPSRYISVRSETYNARALFCIKPTVEGDMASVMAMLTRIRVYSLMQAVNPPEQRFIDMSERLFDTAVRFDDTFFDSLARMVREEPVRTRDLVAMSQMPTLGIDKNGTFAPNLAVREILSQSAEEVHAGLIKASMAGELLSPSARWLKSDAGCSGPGLTYETAFRFGIDERNVQFFMAFETPGKRRRPALCLRTFCDAAGDPLKGAATYRLHIPAGASVKHWEIAAYDLETGCFIRESSRVAINSGSPGTRKNADGSVDVSFASKPEVGEFNWIHTASTRPWFAVFRVYDPERAVFESSWVLPDIEKIG